MSEIKMPSFEEGPFEDVRDPKKFKEELFWMCTGSFASLVRNWARINKISLNDEDGFLLNIYNRGNAVVRYANHIVGSDTDQYSTNLNDRPFHLDLLNITKEIEEGWKKNHTDPEWKKEMLGKIDKRTEEYKKTTS